MLQAPNDVRKAVWESLFHDVFDVLGISNRLLYVETEENDVIIRIALIKFAEPTQCVAHPDAAPNAIEVCHRCFWCAHACCDVGIGAICCSPIALESDRTE